MTQFKTSKAAETKISVSREATKDSGRVQMGGGTIRFADPKPTLDATKDRGRVRVGGGTVHF